MKKKNYCKVHEQLNLFSAFHYLIHVSNHVIQINYIETCNNFKTVTYTKAEATDLYKNVGGNIT